MRLFYIFILFSALTTTALSAEQSYIREYAYKASDLDSRVTARSNALKLIKTGVLEEIISFVNSDSTIGQKQVGDEFRSSFIHHANSQSAGFLKAKILKETWNGYEIWLKAEITADPDKVKDELLKSLAMAKSAAHQAPPRIPVPVQVQPAPVMPVNTVMQDNSAYMFISKFNQAFVLIMPIKMMSMQQHSMYGEWPTKLEQIGMRKEDTNDGQYIDEVRLGKQGEIIALLSKQFGKERVLVLAPKSIMGGTSVRWQCYTNLPVKQINSLSNFNCENDNKLSFKN